MCRNNLETIILTKFSQIDLKLVIDVALTASETVLEIYEKKFDVMYKTDNSPVTDADIESNRLICEGLKLIDKDIPILSEESYESFSKLRDGDYFWCVDPLDGTKEFVNRSDEFTINIALMKNNDPILGVIIAPKKNLIYSGLKDHGSYKQIGDFFEKINVRDPDQSRLKFAVSKSHLDSSTIDYVSRYNATLLKSGSSLKLANVAEGTVDAYPRFGPTMIWDIVAGHCILKEAGGDLVSFNDYVSLNYDLDSFINEPFLAASMKFFELEKYI